MVFKGKPWSGGATLLVLVVALPGCDDQRDRTTVTSPADAASASVSTTEVASNVVARFGDEIITAAELDAHVLRVPPGERPVTAGELDGWYRDELREIAIQRSLLQAAKASGLEQEAELRAARDAAERQLRMEHCVRQRLDALPPLDEADLRQEFEERSEQLRKPERRAVLHIFKRVDGSRSGEAALTELEALRQRVLAGGNFSRLAAEHSESQSRHKAGSLGWIARGELPPAAEDIVFSLSERSVSEPLLTGGGAHLFFVDTVVPARALAWSEALPLLRSELQTRRLDAVLSELAATESGDFGLPPDAAGLAVVLRDGEDSDVLLNSSPDPLTIGEFRQQLRNPAITDAVAGVDSSDPASLQRPWRLLQNLQKRERVRAACNRLSGNSQEILAKQLQAWTEQAMVAAQRQRELLALARAEPDRLRQFHAQNQDQFSTSPRWKLDRLRIDLPEQAVQASRAMARLEQAAAAGSATLDDLQSELGGELESLGWQAADDLDRLVPVLPTLPSLAALIAPLQAGALSAPVRTPRHLEIFRVTSYEPPGPLLFEAVEEQVAVRFVEQYRRDLYERFAAALFAAEPLIIVPGSLEAAMSPDAVAPDDSAEALSELLESL